ncbi:hypothetical protein IWQ61_010116 [Dispira simplex]|nr:hypothetical protein IWQ61_010116 [Dispira simplex]
MLLNPPLSSGVEIMFTNQKEGVEKASGPSATGSDTSTLHAKLAEKEHELQMAAQLGLTLAEQNNALCHQLDRVAHLEHDMADWLRKTEADRRQFLERAYKIDDLFLRLKLVEEALQDQVQLNAKCQKTTEDLRTENTWLKDELRTLTSHFAQIQDSHSTATQSNVKVLHRLHNLEASLEQERVNIHDVKTSLDQAGEKYARHNATLNQGVRTLQDHVQAVLQDLEQLHQRLDTVEKCQTDTESHLNEQVQVYQKLLGEAQTAIETMTDLQSLHSVDTLHAGLSRPSPISPFTGSALNDHLLGAETPCPARDQDSLQLQPVPWDISPGPASPGPLTGRPTSPLPDPMHTIFRPPTHVGLRVLRYLSRQHGRGDQPPPRS